MPNLSKENLFTPWANRHGVTVIAAMPISGDGFWTILAMRVRTVMERQIPEYIAWDSSEEHGHAYNGCYFIQNCDDLDDARVFDVAWEEYQRRLNNARKREKGETRALALVYLDDFIGDDG